MPRYSIKSYKNVNQLLSSQEAAQLIDLFSNQIIDAHAIAQVQIKPWEQAGSVMSPFALGCAKVSRSLTGKEGLLSDTFLRR